MSLAEWYLDEGIRPGEEDSYFDRIEWEDKQCDAGYLPEWKWKDAILRCQECLKGIRSGHGDAKVRYLKAKEQSSPPCEENRMYCQEATVQFVLSNGLAGKTYCCLDCAHTAAQRRNEAIDHARALREETELQARRAARRQRLQKEDVEGEGEDAELEQMQKELEKLEQAKAELDKLNKMLERGAGAEAPADGPIERSERDARSIFIGNVDFSTSVEEVEALFADCGEINAITIPVDKFTGRTKGFAYLEFADKPSILAALEKNNQLLRDRPIKVVNKRTNLPVWQVQPARGRGGFKGSRGWGGPPVRRGYRGGYSGHGRGHFRPY